MKKLISLLILSISMVAIAGDKVDQSLEVEPTGKVEISNVRGEIDVTGWSKDQVKFTGTLDDLTEKFIFTSENGHTLIKVKLPRNTHNRSRDGSKLKVMVPQASKVSFSGVATDLKFLNIAGGLEVNSVSGDIELKEIKGSTYINSVSGNLVLEKLEGRLDISTVSGDLKANVDSRKLNISSVAADLAISVNQIESANISNVSGDSNISGMLNDDGELKMSSVSGEAFYHVKGELSADITMETAPGGDITNEISDHQPKSTFINSHHLRFSVGGGDATIRMTTVSGDIGIKRD